MLDDILTADVIRPANVHPCSDCETNMVDKEQDGITEAFYCADCGTLLADLILGAEP